jgi:lipopolysaccharide cholinephosphotransferase
MALPADVWGDDFRLVTSSQLTPGGFLDELTRLINVRDEVPLRSYDKCADKLNPDYRDRMGIDFFILDNAYDNSFRQKLLRTRLVFIYGLLMGHRDKLDFSEYGGATKLVVRVLSAIGKHMSLDYLHKRYEKVSQSVGNNTGRYFYSNSPFECVGVKFEKEWYNGVVPVPVDGDMFDAPIGYEEVLKAQYGDYMQLPPEDKRKPDHVRL